MNRDYFITDASHNRANPLPQPSPEPGEVAGRSEAGGGLTAAPLQGEKLLANNKKIPY